MSEELKKSLIAKATKLGISASPVSDADFQKLASDVEAAELKAEVVEVVKAGVAPTVELVNKLAEKIEKIEKSPAFSAPAIKTRSSEYKGYKIEKQFGLFRDDLLKKRNNRFEGGLSNEEAQDDYVKNMIDICIATQGDYLKKTNQTVLNAKQALEDRRTKALVNKTSANQEGINSAGGYLIEPDYQWDIIKLARNRSYALQLCRVVNMASLNQYFPQESALGQVIWQPEGTVMTPNEPTFAQVALKAVKAMTLVRVTNEELADNMVDLVSLLTEQFAYATGQELDNQVFNGSGSPWSGIFSSITQSVVFSAGASISTMSFVDLSNAIATLLEARLEGACFVMNRKLKHYVRALKDTYGRPVFAMPGNGVPGTIYEYPYYQSEKISNTDGASVIPGVFGNFNYALLGRRQGVMSVDADPYGMFDSDITRFRMTTRWGFAIGDLLAFVLLKANAS